MYNMRNNDSGTLNIQHILNAIKVPTVIKNNS